jgi:hypothetical protein
MISIETVVYVFFFLLGCGAIFALLYYLVTYCEREFPGAPSLVWKALRILLVIGAVLVLIGIILHLMGHPLVTFGPARP